MANKYIFKLIPLALAAALAACGGSDGDSGNTPAPQPPIVQAPFKLEMLAGSTEVDFSDCKGPKELNTPLARISFTHLERVKAESDRLVLTASSENCQKENVSTVGPLLYTIANGSVRFNSFWERAEFSGSWRPLVVPMFLNSFYRLGNEGGFIVLSSGAAPSETGFELNEALVANYTQRRIWKNFGLGVFSRAEAGGDEGLVAGTPGQPPGYADGKGREARFTAPHDLEGDADGLLYLIDAGRIRTVDQKDWQVRTLDNTALGASGVFKTLDSDRMGRVHAIEQINSGRYVWHRLADKRRVPFTLPQPPAGKTVETFAVIGDELLMAVRGMTAEAGKNASTVYRVNASGQSVRVSGQAQPAQADDWLNDPQKFAWPQVQHLEYGSDGHLYIALPQGVVKAKDFK